MRISVRRSLPSIFGVFLSLLALGGCVTSTGRYGIYTDVEIVELEKQTAKVGEEVTIAIRGTLALIAESELPDTDFKDVLIGACFESDSDFVKGGYCAVSAAPLSRCLTGSRFFPNRTRTSTFSARSTSSEAGGKKRRLPSPSLRRSRRAYRCRLGFTRTAGGAPTVSAITRTPLNSPIDSLAPIGWFWDSCFSGSVSKFVNANSPNKALAALSYMWVASSLARESPL